MHANRLVTSLAVGASALVMFAQSQTPLASDSLRHRLERAYPLTVMDADGFKVSQPGITFAVQQDGIQANSRRFKPFANKYEDGKVSPRGLSNVIPGDITQSRALAVREKVYLIGMVITEDAVTMTVQSCGGCEPAAVDPGHKPHWASIQFKFIKGYLTSTDLEHVRRAIDSLLAPVYVTAPAPVQTTPGVPPSVQQQSRTEGRPTLRRFEEIPPPPPPPTEPTLMRQGENMQKPKPEAETGPASPPAQASSTPTPAPKETELRPEKKKAADLAPKVQDEAKAAQAADPEIQMGWQRDKVNSVLGTPLKDQKVGGQEILTYPHVTVTLEKGRVVAVSKNI
jgi:hypothetical protein